MSRAQTPASPADDLSAHRGLSEKIAEGSVLTFDLSAFMQSGISVIMASVGPDRHPVAGTALACRVDPKGWVRVLLGRSANAALVNAIAQGGALAATFSRPRDHRSIQIKATSARIVSVHADDVTEMARQCAGLRDELINAGYSPIFAAAYVSYEPSEIVGIEFFPDRTFVQTPGPGAGSELPS